LLVPGFGFEFFPLNDQGPNLSASTETLIPGAGVIAQAPRVARSTHRVSLALAVLAAAIVAIPVAGVFANLFTTGEMQGTFAHLASTVLPGYLGTTLWLVMLVAVGVAALGVGSAWLVTMLDFPGRRWLTWALLLPMAMPAYVVAYAYTDFLQFSGPVQSALRGVTGWGPREYWFPDIRSVSGAAFVFTLTLYPYVYLLTRSAFMRRSPGLLDAARLLGCGPVARFFRVVLPLARPAVVAGVTLALMETLADYGTVAYFGVTTLTTGIYRAWFSLSDRAAASQLAAMLLMGIVLLIWLERHTRGAAHFATTGRAVRPPRRLIGWRAGLAWLAGVVPVVLGFVAPVGILLHVLAQSDAAWRSSRYLTFLGNSLTLALTTALVAASLAMALAYAARILPSRLLLVSNRLVSLGYAVPGMVIAVGVLIPLTALDRGLYALLSPLWPDFPGLLLTGSIAALVFACLTRFCSVALQSVESGLASITPNMDAAARSLGCSAWQSFWRVHFPLASPSLLAVILLVFVDTMKELPATLVLRPFNFDTLAVMAFHYASDERLAEAALPSLTLVAAGLLPVILISRAMGRS